VSKCEHGIYIPQGVFDGKSPSCSGCHPENAHIIFTGHRVALGIILERVVDSADYRKNGVKPLPLGMGI
jgi:hypothetical protein